MEFILGFIVGAFVGWTIPQPVWVKTLITTIKDKLLKGKSNE